MGKSSLLKMFAVTQIVFQYAYFTLGYLLPTATQDLDAVQKLTVAPDLKTYFDFIAQKPVTRKSEIHEVLPVQLALENLHFAVGKCGSDGIYGDSVEYSVGQFQKSKGLPQTGEADPDTVRALFREVESNPVAYQQLYGALITPYRNAQVSAFMNDLPNVFSFRDKAALLVRPDVMFAGWVEGIWLNKFRDTVSKEVFAGCRNNHMRDAFRHGDSVYRLSNTYIGSDWAKTVGDIREMSGDNPMPSLLMDLYNHRVAAKLADEHQANGKEVTSIDAFKQAVSEGRFMIYPPPLVPRDMVREAPKMAAFPSS